jgi:hypothetical protein
VRELPPVAGAGILLAITAVCDVVFSLFIPKEWLYRLCAGRYLFLFVLTYVMLYTKIPYKYVLASAFIGAGFVLAHKYWGVNLEPVIFSAWPGERFLNHFYTLVVFMFLYKIYTYVPKTARKILCLIGYYSWEIFLAQMVYFTFNWALHINWYVNIFFSLFICIAPICTYEFMKKPMEIKR